MKQREVVVWTRKQKAVHERDATSMAREIIQLTSTGVSHPRAVRQSYWLFPQQIKHKFHTPCCVATARSAVFLFCEANPRPHIPQAAQMSISSSDAQKYGGLAYSDGLFSTRALRIDVAYLQASC